MKVIVSSEDINVNWGDRIKYGAASTLAASSSEGPSILWGANSVIRRSLTYFVGCAFCLIAVKMRYH
ncbi:hypothetical protein GCM10017044_22800 [Kordiimonas sediminis]|uniref:Uncharacterized protein n=1 Tax=Kordiimonas sediminis TaxID=1735581 RepID=A0A919E9F9_9PROT|nr:hypothetical protein GCM10017044_22800 [Kordiimonas sediminis]